MKKPRFTTKGLVFPNGKTLSSENISKQLNDECPFNVLQQHAPATCLVSPATYHVFNSESSRSTTHQHHFRLIFGALRILCFQSCDYPRGLADCEEYQGVLYIWPVCTDGPSSTTTVLPRSHKEVRQACTYGRRF